MSTTKLSSKLNLSKSALNLIRCLLLTVISAGTARTQSPNYPNFSSIEGLNLVGSVRQFENKLRLTSNDTWRAGTTWFVTQQTIQGGFETTFSFQITAQISSGADGFAFVIQNSAVSALGDYAGALGYGHHTSVSGIPNSVAIEFDTWMNPEYGDPNDNHISVQSRGLQANSTVHLYSLGFVTQIPNMSDGNAHTVRVRYSQDSLQVFLDNLVNSVLTVLVKLDTLLGLDNGRAWVGFTSATGAASEKHDILSWVFHNDVIPPSLADPFLSFPLHYNSWSPYTALITTVFDHSMSARYCPDSNVIAFTGEIGNVKDLIEPKVSVACGDLYSFKKSDGTSFVITGIGNYVGTQQTGSSTLNYDGHPGYDYPVPIGTDVFAAADGQVIVVDDIDDDGSGKYVRIKHVNNYYSQYLHLSQILVLQDDFVTKDQLIAKSGNTGGVEAHLHFEVKINDVSVDPYGWLGEDGKDAYERLTGLKNINLWLGATTPPSIISANASSLTSTSVSLSATVNPNGSTAVGWFEWGTSPTLTTFNSTDRTSLGSGSVSQSFSQVISSLNAGTTYYYRATAKNAAGEYKSDIKLATSVKEVAGQIPAWFSLDQNYPNPFNPATTIRYQLPARSMVRLSIYNMLGQVVTELMNAEQEAGYYNVQWQAASASGIYFYRLEATAIENPDRRFVETKKMLLLR